MPLEHSRGPRWRRMLRSWWDALDLGVAVVAGVVLAGALVGSLGRSSSAADHPWIALGLWLALALVLLSWPRRGGRAARLVLAAVWLGAGILQVVGRLS